MKRALYFMLCLIVGGLIGGIVMLFVVLRPKNMPRTEIFRGIYLQCIDVPGEYGKGKVLAAEIHWNEPGVELFFRPFYPKSTGRKHFSLLPADYLARKYDLSIMINSTRYLPGEWWKSFPTRKVDSMETLVYDGRVSHIHDHSYMFGWDSNFNFHYEFQKPPSPEFLKKLSWGFGVQSINILDGKVHEPSLNPRAGVDARTFVGVDPDKQILWYLVFDNISELGMAKVAQRAGIVVGGQLDASDASTMIIGGGAVGVPSYTGIRSLRPLAAIMGVRAEPLSEED